MANEFDPLPTWRENSTSRPHRWVATSIYELPVGSGRTLMNRKGLLNGIFGGWQVGLIWQAQSGNTIDWGNLFYYGTDTCNIALPAGQRTQNKLFNTDNFEKSTSLAPASYHARVFPSRLNWVRTDPVKQLDANIGKTFRIRESFRAQLRMDLLNALNNQILAASGVDPTSASFGKITTIANIPRYIQFQLRISF